MEETENNFSLHSFNNGINYNAYKYMGVHFLFEMPNFCAVFRVWAPNALNVSVVGDFNGWNDQLNHCKKLSDNGVWECTINDVKELDNYKYSILTKDGRRILKSDIYASCFETHPANASKVYDIKGYAWQDENWVSKKSVSTGQNISMKIYELNLAFWKRYLSKNVFNYITAANELIPNIKEMGYTHIELMPTNEYSINSSWRHQLIGYFAPNPQYGTPHDFMKFIDLLHCAGIGIIFNWIGACFPKSNSELEEFDGGECYECVNIKKSENKVTSIKTFNYDRNEVKSFLISSAMNWFDNYHIDGLRIDASDFMIYWNENHTDNDIKYKNLKETGFLKNLIEIISEKYSHAIIIA